MFLFRLILLPFKLLLALFGITMKAGYQVGRLPARATRRAAGLVGFRGWLFFLAGLALGLLFAPGSGRELRARLQRLLDQAGDSDAELGDKVAFELAHAPRTWHLDQPAVKVVDGRVRLSGTVPTSEARAELARVAGAIPGVAGVDNHLSVGGESVPDEIAPPE
jgi:hypothetical protein